MESNPMEQTAASRADSENRPSDIDPTDWTWLKDKLRDFEHSPARIREELARQRPDLAPLVEEMLARMLSNLPTEKMETQWPSGPSFRPGDLISNRYCVVAEAGRGGMGCVYEVSDRYLPERGSIALKTIRGELASDPQMVARFEREVRLSLSVAHENVCRTFDIGRHGEGEAATLYLTMEFLPGGRVADLLRDQSGRRALPEEEALPLLRQMADGLAAIHAHKIIHRDFKPANVMLAKTASGWRAAITDLGLARTLEETSYTEPGIVMGTHGYIAPEGPGTFGADVYALGVSMLEMLTGQRSAADGPEQALGERGVSQWLQDVVAKCCARDPLQRYRDAGEVARTLKIEDERTRSIAEEPRAAGASAARRKWLLAGTAGALVALAGFSAARFMKPRVPARALELTATAADRLSNNSFLDARRILEQVTATAPHYALAHAMLADADNELELTGRANREMNRIDTADLDEATPDDRMYIEGVRLTLTRDYAGAAERFRRYYGNGDAAAGPARAILLGRALEKAQKPAEAAKAYVSAGKRGGALLSLAVLDSRQQQIPKALSEFEEARHQFEELGEHGAMAGLQYQWGAAYNRWGLLPEAEGALGVCAEQARVEGDGYDALRCRQQLAMIALQRARSDEDFRVARDELTSVVDAAGRQGFQILQARAWLSLGQVDAQHGDDRGADRDYSEALARAENEGSARVKAQVNIVSSDLHRRIHRPADAEREARAALAFYEGDASRKEAGQACIALSRALRDEGDLERAKQTLLERQNLFASLGGVDAAQMHEALATIESEESDYPAAIQELELALQSAPAGANASLDRILMARARIELGMLRQGREILAAVRSAGRLPAMVEESARIAESLADLYELRPSAALPDLNWKGKTLDPILAGLALIGANRAAEGIASCEGVRTQSDPPARRANIELCAAEGYLALHRLYEASEHVRLVEPLIPKNPEAGWRAGAIRIRINEAGSLRDSNESPRSQIRVSLSKLKDMWGPAVMASYLKRPDVERSLRLAKFDKENL